MLAHETFNLALLNKDEAAMELVAAADENIITNKNDEFLILYENLNLSSKITLDSIISNNGRELFRKDLLEEYPIAASTVKKALNTIIEKEILYKTGPEYTFQDVFFKDG